MNDLSDTARIHAERTRVLWPILDELLALPLPPEAEVAYGDVTVFTVSFGWYMRVRRTAEAVRILSDAEYDQEAAPLIRSMIEHAVALLWLQDARDAVVTVIRRMHQRWASNVKAALAETTGWSVDPALFDVFLAAEIPSTNQDHLAAFRNRCEHYQQRDLYVAWLSETQESHPTLITAQAYLAEADGETSQDRQTSSAVPRATPLLLMATETMNALLPEHPWRAQIEDLRARIDALLAKQS